MITGKIKYTRLTYQPSESPFQSGTWKEDLTVKKAVSLVCNYLKRIRLNPKQLWIDESLKQIWSDMSSAYIYSKTSSEMFVGKVPDFTIEEAQEFKKLVQEEWDKRGYGK